MWHPLSRENAMILVNPKTLAHDQADFPIHHDIADPARRIWEEEGKAKDHPRLAEHQLRLLAQDGQQTPSKEAETVCQESHLPTRRKP